MRSINAVLVASLFVSLLIGSEKKKIVFVLAEKEYRTAETVPTFFKEELAPLGFEADFIKETKSLSGEQLENLKNQKVAKEILVSHSRT